MDHTNHVRLTNEELIADNIDGATVYVSTMRKLAPLITFMVRGLEAP